MPSPFSLVVDAGSYVLTGTSAALEFTARLRPPTICGRALTPNIPAAASVPALVLTAVDTGTTGAGSALGAPATCTPFVYRPEE
jgi:hypothetical protein